MAHGDHLTRDEFEERYDATPEVHKAELIEGRVYMMAPPVSLDYHGEPHSELLWWLTNFRMRTPGVRVGDNTSVRMDLDNMPQPDAFLLVPTELGGRARVDERGMVEGAPDLIAEIAASSASYALHEKLRVYRRNGVREYIVWRTFERQLGYFILRGGEYERLAPDEQGRYRSEAFPGLRLDANALLAGDLGAVFAFAQEGLASPDHAAFAARIQPKP